MSLIISVICNTNNMHSFDDEKIMHVKNASDTKHGARFQFDAVEKLSTSSNQLISLRLIHCPFRTPKSSPPCAPWSLAQCQQSELSALRILVPSSFDDRKELMKMNWMRRSLWYRRFESVTWPKWSQWARRSTWNNYIYPAKRRWRGSETSPSLAFLTYCERERPTKHAFHNARKMHENFQNCFAIPFRFQCECRSPTLW